MTDEVAVGVGAEHAAATTAIVTRVPLRELWNLDGRRVYVPEEDVARWLADGWLDRRPDPAAVLADLEPQLQAVQAACRQLLEETQRGGYVSEAAALTAWQAVQQVEAGLSRFMAVLQFLYPPEHAARSQPVRMRPATVAATEARDLHSQDILVDPGQAAQWEQHGYVRVTA